MSKFSVDLGEATDKELDSITIKFDSRDNRYLKFNEANMTIDIDSDIPVGVNTVYFTLIDDNSEPKSSTYKIVIIINEETPVNHIVPVTGSAPEIIDTDQEQDIVVTGIDSLGEITILFSQKMKVP